MDNPKYELIARYLEGDLNAEELHDFEEKLKNDVEFSEDVRLYQEIENSLEQDFDNANSEDELRKTLKKLAQKNNSTSNQTKVFVLRHYSKWLVAASIALVAGLFFFRNTTPTYADYNQHQKMEISVRGSSSEMLVKAQEAFNKKDYHLANVHLSRLSEYYKDNAELQLYYGISLLETDQYDLANIVFTNIAKSSSILKDEAHWYLALTALKQKDNKTCKKYLLKIPEESEFYDRAKSLIKRL